MKYIGIGIFLMISLLLYAQDKTEEIRLPVFRQVTHPFMPPISSSCFFFSQDGLLWFSTAKGLTSFDGSEIVHYGNRQQLNQFGLAQIRSIAEDAKHNFYIGTATGFYYYNRSSAEYTPLYYTYLDSPQQVSPAVFTVFLDKKTGLVYGGCGNAGLFVYEPSTQTMRHYNLDSTKPDSWQDRRYNTIVSFAEHATDSNKLWMGTYHGIYLFDKKQRKFYQNFEITTNITHKYNPAFADKQFIDVSFMDVVNDSVIWFNSWTGGLAKYNTQTGKASIVFGRDAVFKAKDVYYGHYISGFVKLKPDTYLVGIFNGRSAVFDTRKNKPVYFNATSNNHIEDEIRYIRKDGQGNIWLLQRGMLYISVPEKLRLQRVLVSNRSSLGLNKPKIRGLYFDQETRLLYAAFLGSTGVHVYDNNFRLQKLIPTSLINNYYNYGSTVDTKITKDGSGRFWTTGWKMHVLKPGAKKFERIETIFPALARFGQPDKFVDIVATRSGDILIKSIGGVIYHINHQTLSADTIHVTPGAANGVEIKNPTTWYDERRNLVYLNGKQTLAQYNLSNRQMNQIPQTSLFGNLPPGKGVYACALDAGGRLWLMIPKFGVRIIDPQSLRCIDSIEFGSKGLMRGDHTDILGGSYPFMFFRSQNGIVLYNYEKRNSFLFDQSNGLSSPDNRSFLHSNGYLVIGQSELFEYFKLAYLAGYTSTVNSYLNSILADTTLVFRRTGFNQANTIKLLHHQNTLSFSFSALEFFFPERIEYAYQLLPVDKDWHYSNYFNRQIIYSELAPGNYTFRLMAQMQGGNWDGKWVEYNINIAPAWWQTIWLKLIVGMGVLLLMIMLVQRRIRFIRQTEQERLGHEKALLELEAKALRAQMNPHFIFNCLNSIKSLIQQHEAEKAVTYLTTFSKLIRVLFINADRKEISLHDEVETCKLYLQLESMRFDTQFSFEVYVDSDIDLKSVQVPALIVQPFIENAIWHGIVPRNRGGHVWLQVLGKATSIEVVIEDDGIGREASQQNKSSSSLVHQSKGVNLTQSRLELNNLLQQRQANLQLIDKRDENGLSTGTKVIITFKKE